MDQPDAPFVDAVTRMRIGRRFGGGVGTSGTSGTSVGATSSSMRARMRLKALVKEHGAAEALPLEASGRIIWVTGGIGSGRTAALQDAVELCRAANVDSRLLLPGDPATPDTSVLLDEVITAARRGPTVLALDDADRPGSDVLAGVVEAAPLLRTLPALVLVVTSHSSGGHSVPSDPLLRRLASVSERLHLEPLDTEELDALLRSGASTGQPPSPAVVEELLRSTGGIPRLVAAARAELLDEGRRAGGRARLIAAAERMLAALDPTVLEVVACAALIDQPFDPAIVARAAGADDDRAIGGALASGILIADRAAEPGELARPTGPVRLRFAAEALRAAAGAHDEAGRARRSLAIARAMLESDGTASDLCVALCHLRLAGSLVPQELLGEVAEAALAEARLRGELVGQVDALEALRSVSRQDVDRWRALGSELATVALHVGRRDRAWIVARSVLRSFDGVPDEEFDDARRQVFVDAILAATTGQEYLSHEESDEAYELLMRSVARLGEDGGAARLLCRAAEIISMRPHASALVRPWLNPELPVGPQGDSLRKADEKASALLDRAEALLGGLDHGDAALTATLDVAWARSHLHHDHAQERRARLARSLHHLEGFDRAWAGTRLALDALAVGDRDTVQQALIDASPSAIDHSPLVAWRVGTVRAMLSLASGMPGARAAVERAAELGERAAEPMAGVVALVQRGIVRVETDLSPLSEAELTLAERDVHPLILIGRLEIRARMAAIRWRMTGDFNARLTGEAAGLLEAIRAGRMNRGNQQLAIVLLARVLFLLRHETLDEGMVREVVELLEPLGDLVPTDTLGLACAGSAARHLANLRALEGRHDEAADLAEHGRLREETLGLERFLISGRIEAVERAMLAGKALGQDARAELIADAVDAERRELLLLGREARLVAHPELMGLLDRLQVELLEDLAEGLAFPDIAQRRGYSAGTMRKMALPIYRALGVSGRDEAVELGREAGLLTRPRGAAG